MNEQTVEQWRPIPGWLGYEASDHGRVRSHRRGAPRVLGGRARSVEGYPIVALSRNGTTSKLPVHRWVALAFLGPHPPGQQVRHLDGDPTHNAPGNLRYGTASQNARDSVGHGTHVQARKEECAQGHRLTAGNVYQWRGRRKCRTCRARRSAERYLAEKRARAHASP